jgi:hypothetical protein
MKWGAKTLGTDIPIISEDDARAKQPDYFLVLPYHFLDEMLVREIAPEATITWGGLVLTGDDDNAASAKAASRSLAPDVLVGGPGRIVDGFAAYVARGAQWVIAGPIWNTSTPRTRTRTGQPLRRSTRPTGSITSPHATFGTGDDAIQQHSHRQSAATLSSHTPCCRQTRSAQVAGRAR